jgi:hypothetical protein
MINQQENDSKATLLEFTSILDEYLYEKKISLRRTPKASSVSRSNPTDCDTNKTNAYPRDTGSSSPSSPCNPSHSESQQAPYSDPDPQATP